MKPHLLLLLFTFSLMACARADYTGTVSEVKHFSGGGVAVDMDGTYPDQKMTLYVSPGDAAAVGALPEVGTKVSATGEVTDYKGRPEIKIHSKDQWSW